MSVWCNPISSPSSAQLLAILHFPAFDLAVLSTSTVHLAQSAGTFGSLQTSSSPAEVWLGAVWGQGSGRSVYSLGGLRQQPTGLSGAVSLIPGARANVSGELYPYAEISVSLGVHLHPATKVKNWRRYVDIFSLLFHEPESKPWAGCGAVAMALQQYQCPKVDRN